MGIFDDEARKMVAEAAQKPRSGGEQVGELSRFARSVADELEAYLDGCSQAEAVSTELSANIVRMIAEHRTLEIVCDGPQVF